MANAMQPQEPPGPSSGEGGPSSSLGFPLQLSLPAHWSRTSLPPVTRQPHGTHCQGCGTSGCLARGRWGRRAERNGWRRKGAASARRPLGAGSCVVSGGRLGSSQRREPVPAAAMPGPATGGSAWPRRPLAARFCLPERVRGSAIAESGAESPKGAAPAGPMGSLRAGHRAGPWSGARTQWARGGGGPFRKTCWGLGVCLSCAVGRVVRVCESPGWPARAAGCERETGRAQRQRER